jgi:hypothetical protein
MGSKRRTAPVTVKMTLSRAIAYKLFQNRFFVILNEVKALNLLKMQDSSLRSE